MLDTSASAVLLLFLHSFLKDGLEEAETQPKAALAIARVTRTPRSSPSLTPPITAFSLSIFSCQTNTNLKNQQHFM